MSPQWRIRRSNKRGQALQSCGDANIRYGNGLELFGEADVSLMPDSLHPDAAGYRLMAERFVRYINGGLGGLVRRAAAGDAWAE